DISGDGSNLYQWASSVQRALGSNTLWSWPVAALATDANFGKVRVNAVTIRELNIRAHSDVQIGSKINRHVTRSSLKHGIRALIPRNELRPVSPRSVFRRAARSPFHLESPPAGFCMNSAGCGCQSNAPASGLNLRRAADLTQINAAAAGGCFQMSTAAF